MPVLKRLKPSEIVLTATTGAAAPGVRSWVCVRACVHECASECVCARAQDTVLRQILGHCLLTMCLKTVCSDTVLRQCLKTVCQDSV